MSLSLKPDRDIHKCCISLSDRHKYVIATCAKGKIQELTVFVAVNEDLDRKMLNGEPV